MRDGEYLRAVGCAVILGFAGAQVIFKPASLHVPLWQLVFATLGGNH